ncbi:60S ribosomal protein L39, partial [Ophiophagus hannah]
MKSCSSKGPFQGHSLHNCHANKGKKKQWVGLGDLEGPFQLFVILHSGLRCRAALSPPSCLSSPHRKEPLVRFFFPSSRAPLPFAFLFVCCRGDRWWPRWAMVSLSVTILLRGVAWEPVNPGRFFRGGASREKPLRPARQLPLEWGSCFCRPLVNHRVALLGRKGDSKPIKGRDLIGIWHHQISVSNRPHRVVVEKNRQGIRCQAEIRMVRIGVFILLRKAPAGCVCVELSPHNQEAVSSILGKGRYFSLGTMSLYLLVNITPHWQQEGHLASKHTAPFSCPDSTLQGITRSLKEGDESERDLGDPLVHFLAQHRDHPHLHPQKKSPITSQSSHKTFKIKRFLAKKQKQNRPIPQWIRMKTGNKIRSHRRFRWDFYILEENWTRAQLHPSFKLLSPFMKFQMVHSVSRLLIVPLLFQIQFQKASLEEDQAGPVKGSSCNPHHVCLTASFCAPGWLPS